MKLLDNFYTYAWQGRDNNCNTSVFAGVLNGGRHLIVDPGHVKTPYYREAGLERLIQEMDKDGLDIAATGLIILTHSHTDHCESAMSIREKSQALIAIHEEDAPAYQQTGGKIDLFLQDGELLLGSESPCNLEVIHAPGHSPGHITLYWPQQMVLIAGDVVFYHSTGRVDLPGGNSRSLKDSLKKLSLLDVEYLICGHPYQHRGIIQGRDAVRGNFEFLRRYSFF